MYTQLYVKYRRGEQTAANDCEKKTEEAMRELEIGHVLRVNEQWRMHARAG